MIIPPLYYPGVPRSIANGAPAVAADVVAIDRATTWLVAARASRPAIIGAPMESGNTYTLTTLMPCYTTHVAFAVLATGRGEVAIGCDEDSYNCVVAVDTAGDTAVDGTWIWAADAVPTTTDGLERALEVTDQDAPHEVTLTVDITDDDPSTPVKVWQWLVYPLPRVEALV